MSRIGSLPGHLRKANPLMTERERRVAMVDIAKLSTVLDDPEVQQLLYGLTHVGPRMSLAPPGPARLHAMVLHLADTTRPEQYRSWLSDSAPNMPMTVEQVRLTIGDTAIADLAQFTSGSPATVAWQLASVLPEVVDAVSPGGQVVDSARLAREIADAIAFDDRLAGAFGR
ncbi:YidB family protein [Actinoplanes sp. NPDC048791]|uniref:YidB family protein n=1 Tax=Actinoplanes sp. NPDC048791 TaxID=3154623 RepID=UPI0033FDD844